MTYLPQAKRFDWSNLGIRVASAVVLVPAVLAAVWSGGAWYLLLVAVGVALLAVEWAQMTSARSPIRVAAAVTAVVLAGVVLAYTRQMTLAWAAVLGGGTLAALIARGVSERPSDAFLGAIYIGGPAICLVWLRSTHGGVWWTYALFAVTWAADIGAFAVGNVLKGPKLWPRFSPNKTWSGFAGGLVAAMAACVIMARYTSLPLGVAAAGLFGLLGGLATMAGDLWESMLKRRFGVKDSGDLIPGHGGLLDRVDGLMFAVVIVSAGRLINQLGWPV